MEGRARGPDWLDVKQAIETQEAYVLEISKSPRVTNAPEHLISPNNKCQTLELATFTGAPQTFREHSGAIEEPPGSSVAIQGTVMPGLGTSPQLCAQPSNNVSGKWHITMYGGFQGESCETETLKAKHWQGPLGPGESISLFLAGRQGGFPIFLAILLPISTSFSGKCCK